MAKPQLFERDEVLESQIIATMLEGHHLYRPDLDYPQSHSDMQAAVRGLLKMFKVERRPLAEPLKLRCSDCKGSRELAVYQDGGRVPNHWMTCETCNGRGWVEG